MNTELMIKAQTLLYSNTDKLEALVEALESVCTESNTEVPETPAHPLMSYTVSEKDIGSFVRLSDSDNRVTVKRLLSMQEGDFKYVDTDGSGWRYAQPYTNAIKLHFKPWVATEENDPPSDLKRGTEWFAVLFEDGDWEISNKINAYYWGIPTEHFSAIVGYYKLDFVNPIWGM